MSDDSVSITISEIRPTVFNEAALEETVQFDYSIIWIPVVGVLVVAATVWFGFFLYQKWQNKNHRTIQRIYFANCARLIR